MNIGDIVSYTINTNTNFTDLNFDIIIEISRYLTIKEICILKKTNKIVYNCIMSSQNIIITNHIKKYFKCTQLTDFKNTMTKITNEFLNNYLFNYESYLKSYFKPMYFKKFIIRDIHYKIESMLIESSYNNNDINFEKTCDLQCNLLFSKVFLCFVQNDCANIFTKYYNKFDLLYLYIIIQTRVYKNTLYAPLVIDFLETLNEQCYKSLRLGYYNFMLARLHESNEFYLTFDRLYKMSKTVISTNALKKIIGYKTLDLQHATFNLCCGVCNEILLSEICKYKFKYKRDELVSHNYKQFKLLLKSNKYLYNILIQQEDNKLNELLYIRHPKTNRRMRVNGTYYRTSMKELYENDIEIYFYTIYKLNKTRNKLRRIYF